MIRDIINIIFPNDVIRTPTINLINVMYILVIFSDI